MKRLLVMVGILVVFAASGQAGAQPREGRMQPPPGKGMGPQQMPAREDPERQRMRERMMRMTPEARQQLRRDIHDHGREIYREAPKDAPR